MKIFKEYPLLLIWMLLLTIAVGFSLFKVRVSVSLHTPQNAHIAIESKNSVT